jgi:thioredoxin 1
MMIERMLISTILIIMIVVVWAMFRYLHMRRASQVVAIKITPSAPTLLYFSSDHCAPCVTQAHYLNDFRQEYRDRVYVRTINTDLNPELATRYGVFTVPTTLIIDEGGEVRNINYGLTGPSRLAHQLEKIL